MANLTVSFSHSPNVLIDLLHTPETVISLSPYVTAFTADKDTEHLYHITATFPSPLGVGTTVSNYTLLLTQTPDGTRTIANADTGIKTTSVWTVKGAQGAVKVTKQDTVEGPWVLKQFVVSQLKKMAVVLMDNLKKEADKKTAE